MKVCWALSLKINFTPFWGAQCNIRVTDRIIVKFCSKEYWDLVQNCLNWFDSQMNDNIWFKFNQFSATLPSGPEAIRSASIPCSATSAQILKFCHIARPQACHFVISSFCWSSCNRIQIQVLTSPFWREWVLSNFWVVQTGSSQQCW